MKASSQTVVTALTLLTLAIGVLDAKTSSADTPAPGTLDGVLIEAVEPYPVQARSELLLSFGIYPFNAYFNSFSFDLAFDHWISRSFTWEVINFNYLYSVDRGLTQELADLWQVNPDLIERPTYMASTLAIYNFIYGKFVSWDQKIRYFKTGALFGGGVIGTSVQTLPTVNIGLRFDCNVSDSFSWQIEVRDAIAPTKGGQNFVTFHLGGGFSL